MTAVALPLPVIGRRSRPLTGIPTASVYRHQALRGPVLWGLVIGAIQATSPLAIWWLDQATVHALCISLVASV